MGTQGPRSVKACRWRSISPQNLRLQRPLPPRTSASPSPATLPGAAGAALPPVTT